MKSYIFWHGFSTLSIWCALGWAASSQDSNSKSCDCYVTDALGYFQYHRFYDFRNMIDTSGALNSEPDNVTDNHSTGAEPVNQDYFTSTAFTKDWTISTWGRNVSVAGRVKQQNSRQNVWIQKDESKAENTAFLALRTYRNSALSSNGEMVTQVDMLHASIRTFARIRGDSGAVAGIFTYFNDSQESDIEFLTREQPSLIYYTNQPNTNSMGRTVAAASTNVTMPNQAVWSDWNTYRHDWLPGLTQWYINGTFSANKTYGVPTIASSLILNVWSNGGNWSGNMSIGSAAYLEIQWIDLFYNTTQSSTSPSNCHTVCAADDVRQVGYPEVLYSSDAMGRLASSTRTCFWIVLVSITLISCFESVCLT